VVAGDVRLDEDLITFAHAPIAPGGAPQRNDGAGDLVTEDRGQRTPVLTVAALHLIAHLAAEAAIVRPADAAAGDAEDAVIGRDRRKRELAKLERGVTPCADEDRRERLLCHATTASASASSRPRCAAPVTP